MKIIDLVGGSIIVTDLKSAITQVQGFIELGHEDAAQKPSLRCFEQKRLEYWKDMQEKLLQLQSEIDKNTNP